MIPKIEGGGGRGVPCYHKVNTSFPEAEKHFHPGGNPKTEARNVSRTQKPPAPPELPPPERTTAGAAALDRTAATPPDAAACCSLCAKLVRTQGRPRPIR